MDNLMVFNNDDFGEIRTVMINNEPWFVGKDIATILGYAKPLNALATHVDKDDSLKQGLEDSMGRMQETIFINESGIYSLVFSSKLESAKRFKNWVTREVLPSIRKTGGYKIPKSPTEQLKLLMQATLEVDEKVESLANDFEQFKQEMPLLGVDMDEITHAVHVRGVNALGGKDSLAYQDGSLRQKVYSDIYKQLKYQFDVQSYKALARNQVKQAIAIIDEYELPVFLQNAIESANNQMRLGD